MAGYIPEGDQAFLTWLENFGSKLGTYSGTFGITAAEVTAVNNDRVMLTYLVGGLAALRPAVQSWTAYKDLIREGPLGAAAGPVPLVPAIADPPTAVPPGIEQRVRSLAQRIKSHTAYTTAIGEDLQIIAPAEAPAGTPKPTGTAAALPNSQVQITFVKRGFDGVRVESQRAAETAWAMLGVDTQSPYVDTRDPLEVGQPEVRRYRLRYVKSDEPLGDYSDVMTVTTVP